jgi:deoxyhypusine synthase
MGRYLEKNGKNKDSIVLQAYKKNVPIFVPAFSDCSAGFGLVMHQVAHPKKHVSIDSVKDFRELTQLKIKARETGLLMIGGGVPKNFAQDVVVAAELLGSEVPLHKYAIQITVADERDGALSGSTLREACSWGKVSVVHEQMVYCEATIALPLLAGYVYHKGNWRNRKEYAYNRFLTECAVHPVMEEVMA